MDSPIQWVLVLFFGVFQLLGGVALGSGTRHGFAAFAAGADAEARSAHVRQGFGALVFGVAFGGASLLMEAVSLAPISRWFLVAGGLVFVLAALGSAFIPQQTLSELGTGTLTAIGLGLVALPMAALVALEGFRKGDPLFGLIWGGCAGFVGFVFLSTGLSALLHGQSLTLRSKGPGVLEISPELDGADPAPSGPAGRRTRRHQKK